jgi:phosphate transport system substrate-binding protein
MAEQIPGSLVGSTLAQIVTERRNLRPVALDGVEPTFANFEAGSYRYRKTLYFVVRTSPGPAVERFMRFMQSPEGQTILRRAAIVP